VDLAARVAGERDYRNLLRSRLSRGGPSLFRNVAAIDGLARFMSGLKDRPG